MIRAGVTASEAAALIGVHHTSILKWAREAGVVTRRRGRPPAMPAATVRAVRQRLNDGASPTTLANELGLPRRTVRSLADDPARRLDAVRLPAELEIPPNLTLTAEQVDEHARLVDWYQFLAAALAKVGTA